MSRLLTSLLVLLFAQTATAYQAEIRHYAAENIFAKDAAFVLQLELVTSQVTEQRDFTISVNFSDNINVNLMPGACQQMPTEILCSVTLQPHQVQRTEQLSFSLSSSDFGQLISRVTLDDSDDSQDSDLSDNLSVWSGYVAEEYSDPTMFSNVHQILAYDPDSDGDMDLAVIATENSRIFMRTYINDAGDISLPSDNRYFSYNINDLPFTVTNNDSATSSPELIVHNVSGHRVLRQTTNSNIVYQPGGSDVTIPADTPYYAPSGDTVRAVANLLGARKLVSADLDADMGEDANTGEEHLYISQQNNRISFLLEYSYSEDSFNGFSNSFHPIGTTNIRDGIFADLNGDNRADMILARNGSNQFRLAQNAVLAGRFPNAVNFGGNQLSRAIAAIDVDRDGDKDLVSADRYRNSSNQRTEQLRIFINDGNGNFSSGSQTIPTAEVDQLAVVDMFGDNEPELFVAHSGKVFSYETSTEGLVFNSKILELNTPFVVADLDKDGKDDVAGDRVYLASDVTAVPEPDPVPEVPPEADLDNAEEEEVAEQPMQNPEPSQNPQVVSVGFGAGTFSGIIGMLCLLLLGSLVYFRGYKKSAK